MWTEKIGFPFENVKTLSTFCAQGHLMHCSSISCTSNFYENLKRLLVDSLITFSFTTCESAPYMEVIIIKKRKSLGFSVCLFVFMFGRRDRRCGRKKKTTKQITFMPFCFCWILFQMWAILVSAKHTCVSLDLTAPSSLSSKGINYHALIDEWQQDNWS